MVLIVALAFSSFSGGDCWFTKNTIDKFTGEKTKSRTFTLHNDKTITLGSVGKQLSLTYSLALAGQMRDNLMLTDTLFIVLQSGKRIKLGPNEETKPVVFANQVIYSTYTPIYNMSRKKMQLLSASPITDIRIMIAGKPIDAEVDIRDAKDMMQIAGCLIADDEAETK